MMNVTEQLKLLADSCLHEDVKVMSGILLTLSDHNPDMLSLAQKYQTQVYQADAHFHLGQQKKAEGLYMKALHTKKMLNKTKGKTAQPEIPSEVDVRFRLHECYCEMKQLREAITMLDGISAKQRNAKVNMALAKLYQRTGNDRSAITSYKEVLRECPLSLEAAQGLLSLGVKGAEVASFMMSTHAQLAGFEWLSQWIKAQAHTASREYVNAVQTYRVLDNKSYLRDNVDMLCCLGNVQFLNGDYSQATTTLQRVHALDRLNMSRMDILAYLLYKQHKPAELEKMASELMNITEQAAEPWVAMGYFCLSTKKATRAVYFAQKAFSLDGRGVEALLLKGTALLELKKITDSISHYREAMRLEPHRYEAHKGLVDCYIGSHRTREAIQCAAQAYKQLGTNARSLTLYAGVLAKEPMSLEKAKTYLEKALKLDPSHLDAVYIMADIFSQQHHFDKGIELLRRQLRQQSTCRLHQMLADFLMHTNEHEEALNHYSIAINLDPHNSRAREGIERVEKHSDLGLDATYDVEVEDMEGSENEADLEGSDIESAWSDIDLT